MAEQRPSTPDKAAGLLFELGNPLPELRALSFSRRASGLELLALAIDRPRDDIGVVQPRRQSGQMRV
jgi:hypothetical protein